MKGKFLENIILAVGLLVIGAAVFLMFIDDTGIIAQRVNLIFSIGFIFYIAYSYLLSKNLNTEIRGLEKHVDNLKEEVGRQKIALSDRDKTINEKTVIVSSLTATVEEKHNALLEKTAALENANTRISELENPRPIDEI